MTKMQSLASCSAASKMSGCSSDIFCEETGIRIMTTSLTWLGHGAWQLDTAGQRVLIDPFFTGNPAAAVTADAVAADFILVSHGHGDHIGDTVAIARRTGATVVANYEIAGWLQKQGLTKVHPQ